MIATYLDSSALVRYCVTEGELETVEEAMNGFPVTSALAAVEVPMAVHARFHRGQIDLAERDRLLEIVERTLESVGQVGLSPSVRREAVTLAEGTLLRALDAVHVGTAVVVSRVQQRRGNKLNFCTGDVRQREVAVACFGRDRVTVLPPL